MSICNNQSVEVLIFDWFYITTRLSHLLNVLRVIIKSSESLKSIIFQDLRCWKLKCETDCSIPELKLKPSVKVKTLSRLWGLTVWFEWPLRKGRCFLKWTWHNSASVKVSEDLITDSSDSNWLLLEQIIMEPLTGIPGLRLSGTDCNGGSTKVRRKSENCLCWSDVFFFFFMQYWELQYVQ